MLRVVDGGRAPRRAGVDGVSAGVFLRRRIVAAILAAIVLVVLVVGVQAAASLLAAPSAPTTSSAAAMSSEPIGVDTYVVRPGDTLWSIASRLDPAGDPRPLVDALRARAGGAALEAGQHIDVSGLGA